MGNMVKKGGGGFATCPFTASECMSECALLVEFDMPHEIGSRYVCAFALPSRTEGRIIPLPFLSKDGDGE